jgi:hypothetical protein
MLTHKLFFYFCFRKSNPLFYLISHALYRKNYEINHIYLRFQNSIPLTDVKFPLNHLYLSGLAKIINKSIFKLLLYSYLNVAFSFFSFCTFFYLPSFFWVFWFCSDRQVKLFIFPTRVDYCFLEKGFSQETNSSFSFFSCSFVL